jgi:2'-5' RNA ligase
MRLFIAVELEDAVREKIAGLVSELKKEVAGVRWVEGKNLHLTLKFLGWVEDKKIEEVIALMERAAKGRGGFKAKVEGVGSFPIGPSPRVIWVGLREGSGKLSGLAEEIGSLFSHAGYRREEKAFASHVTIGRVKEEGNIREKLAGLKTAAFGESFIGALALMKSELTPQGPVYEKLKEVKL